MPTVTITPEAYAALRKKAELLDLMMAHLADMGFGKDEPISGADCVDWVAELYAEMKERLT